VFAGTPLAGLLERVKAPHAPTNGGGSSRPTIPPPPGKT